MDEPFAADPPLPPPPGSATMPTPPEPPGPFTVDEIRRATVRPHLVADLVLARPDRLARNLAEGRHAGWLAGLLLVASLAFAVPFGAVPPVGAFWKIAALYAGSVLICVPSLHVFGAYLGFRLTPTQNLALALVVAATAARFAFGLAPIVWFIDATTEAGETASATPTHVASAFLTLGLVMGVAQLVRCLGAARDLARRSAGLRVLLGCWVALLVFITYRMAGLLDLV